MYYQQAYPQHYGGYGGYGMGGGSYMMDDSSDDDGMYGRGHFITERAPKNHLYFSVFTTIFCFFPVGILAIISSIRSSEAADDDDFEDAEHYSKKAKKYNYIAIVFGLIIYIVTVVITMLKLGIESSQKASSRH